MPFAEHDTIAAIATPAGEGAISVIRVSGKTSIAVVDQLFRSKVHLANVPSHTVQLGTMLSPEGEVLDQVLATVFKAPNSYTGEEVVEIGCHGGILLSRRILESLLSCGIRQAEPGEFTKRAFLNGKLDLSQAEAVADLISSKSKKAQISSLTQLHGKLGEKIGTLRKTLIDFCSLLELGFDFAEEGIDLVDSQIVTEKIASVKKQVENLIESYKSGKIIRDGFSICIVGDANVGKSSIFNSILVSERSIVTEIAGTTRDTIEENVNIEGFLIKLIDTAGIRETSDLVETEGITRTDRAIEGADAICFVSDITNSNSLGIISNLKSKYPGKPYVLVLNKVDLFDNPQKIENGPEQRVVLASAKTNAGINQLKKSFVDLVLDGLGGISSDIQVTNLRHLECLKKANKSLENALKLSQSKSPNELLAFEIRESADSIGEINGSVTSDEILNNIFSRFCIGK